MNRRASGNAAASSMFDRLLPEGPAAGYLLLALIAGIMVVLWIDSRGWGSASMVFALLLIAACLLGRGRFAAPLFLAGALAVLFVDRLDRFGRGGAGAGIDLPRWFVGFAVMVFLISITRYQSLAGAMFPAPRKGGSFWTRMWRAWQARGNVPDDARRRDPSSCWPWEQWSVPVWAVTWLAVAQIALAVLPEGGSLARHYGLDRRAWRVVMVVWLGVVMVAGVRGTLAYLRWRRLNRAEAGVYLRSVLWQYSAREQGALERYSERRKRRRWFR